MSFATTPPVLAGVALFKRTSEAYVTEVGNIRYSISKTWIQSAEGGERGVGSEMVCA